MTYPSPYGGTMRRPDASGSPAVGRIPTALRVLAILLIAALAILPTASFAADCSEAQQGHVRGPFGILNPAQHVINVGDMALATDGDTEYLDDNNDPIEPSAIPIGQFVEAEFCPPGSGNALAIATKVKIEDPGGACEFETRGNIRDLNTAMHRFHLGDAVIIYTAGTNFENLQGNPAGPEILADGRLVEVKGCVREDGAVVATRISAEDGSGGGGENECDFEARGFIRAIEADTHVLHVEGFANLLVQVTNTTDIFDDENDPITFDDLAVNDFVELKLCPTTSGAWVARRVRVRDNDGGNNWYVQLSGMLTEANPTSGTLVVAGVNVLTNDETRFFDAVSSTTITINDLTVPSFVTVRGTRLGDMSVLAKEVIVRGDAPPTPTVEVEFRGPINEIASDGSLLVGDRRVVTDNQTVYLDENRTPITFADLAVGDFVEVKGIRQGDQSVLARRIKMEDRVAVEVRLVGRIDEITNDAFHIAGQVVTTNAETVYLDRDNNEVAREFFSVGDGVEAEGTRAPGAPMVAKRIALRNEGTPSCVVNIEFGGAVAAVDVDARTLTVGDRLVLVENFTRIHGPHGQPLTLDTLAVGDNVHVEGNTSDTLVVIACEIAKRENGNPGEPNNVILFGEIDSTDLANNSIVVDETPVKLVDITLIIGRRGEQLPRSVLQPGLRVLVFGLRLGDGGFTAFLIHVVEENHGGGHPEDVHVVGLIRDLSLPTSMVVRGRTIDLTGNPEVEGLGDEQITLDDLVIGDLVEVEGTRLTTDTLLATEINVRAAVIEAIDETSRTLTVAGITVEVPEAAQIIARGAGEITFADLAVGDLVRIRGTWANDTTFVADLVVRMNPVNHSGTVGTFAATQLQIEGGRPALVAPSNVDAFGYLETAHESFGNTAGAIYEVRTVVSTNVADKLKVPTVRLRLSSASWQKSALLNIESDGQGQFAPTPEGREYVQYFVPIETPTGSFATLKDWFGSLDILNFAQLNAANGSARLDSITARPIDLGKVTVTEKLVENDFANGSNGWYAQNVAEVFTPAVATSGLNGTLDLAASDRETFGFWQTNTGVEVEGNTLYRARFLVRAASQTQQTVPTFRLRLGLSDFQLATVVNVESVNGADESPTDSGRLYDVYLWVPANPTPGTTLQAGFDLANFQLDDDLMTAVSLDHFVLEKLAISE